ncbi:MAG: M48 family metallopeptidase [Deltaproteobacteria bacterium]|nr:M48 family metallopeptidase [Deltaproteobacteria bacterium]
MKKYFTILVVPFLFFGCTKDYVTGKSTLNVYSLNSDITLGNDVMKQQLAELKKADKKVDMDADPVEFKRVRSIVNRITPHTHLPNLPYEVHLAGVDIVNAWCAPGGKVMVYTGLWEPRKGLVQKGNEDELAAVLSHEIAHATARHVTENISRITTIQMAGVVASAAISQAGSAAASNTFGEVFTNGLNVYVPFYSRKSETEADAIGIMYMASAGYNPQAVVNLWERAAKESKSDQTSIYASHPANGARAAALKKLLPQAMEIYQAAIKKKPNKKSARL